MNERDGEWLERLGEGQRLYVRVPGDVRWQERLLLRRLPRTRWAAASPTKTVPFIEGFLGDAEEVAWARAAACLALVAMRCGMAASSYSSQMEPSTPVWPIGSECRRVGGSRRHSAAALAERRPPGWAAIGRRPTGWAADGRRCLHGERWLPYPSQDAAARRAGCRDAGVPSASSGQLVAAGVAAGRRNGGGTASLRR